MDRIQIAHERLWFRDTLLGPTKCLLADPGELKHMALGDGVIHRTLPRRVDLIWTVGNSVVVGEMKRPDDLVSSVFGARLEPHHRHGRLARQLRACLDLGDVAVLILRDLPPLADLEIWTELVRIQACGIFILPVPDDEKEIVSYLWHYCPNLDAGSHGPV